MNIRPTSGVLIPALLMLWLNAQGTGLNRRELFGALFSPPLLVTAASFAGLCLASVLFGSWFDGAGNAPLNLDGFVWNAASYYYGTTYGIFAVFVVPLALMGLAHLWRSNHIYTWVFAYIIVIWPLVHAPFAPPTDTCCPSSSSCFSSLRSALRASSRVSERHVTQVD